MLPIPVEHFHPLIVHFPIALWVTATLCFFLSFTGFFRNLQGPAVVMGCIGTGLGWLAKVTGEKAAEIVGRTLCPIELLDKHAEMGETALIFFTGIWVVAALLYFLRGRAFFPSDTPLVLKIVLALSMLLANAYLTLASHKGYQLVYLHGAGVKTSIERCD